MSKMKSVIGCGLIILSAAVMNPMQTDSASREDVEAWYDSLQIEKEK